MNACSDDRSDVHRSYLSQGVVETPWIGFRFQNQRETPPAGWIREHDEALAIAIRTRTIEYVPARAGADFFTPHADRGTVIFL